MDAIVTRNLSKVYKGLGKGHHKSLDSLSLTVAANEVFGFLGRNGAGKTTTIKMLCSLLKPTEGDALVFGESTRTRQARRLIGYLPEQPYFYEYLNPKETIAFYGKLQGLTRAERDRQWDKLSELLDLREIATQRIKGFSKGMRQRIGFAVALVGDPPLLILDEPMSGLDPIGRRMIRELILRLRDEKKTLFFSSHVLGDVEQICDRVGILVKGKLVRAGRIDALLGSAVNPVEVICTGLAVADVTRLKEQAELYRAMEELHVFRAATPEIANEMVRQILAAGGKLVEFNPLKETLEDYFMREQTQDGTVRMEGAIQ
ncbi:MAG: ABC transporter ATP-binding protein [Candidatus Hydrogenedentes bacterium]|nr:ABC transporter ATP-binding protein [Candidatus Hydrogenedentota bacterium]